MLGGFVPTSGLELPMHMVYEGIDQKSDARAARANSENVSTPSRSFVRQMLVA
jgi:hypothetical protein